MSFLNLFNKNRGNLTEDKVLQANATLYPDKIVIETTDRVKEGFGISSTNVTVLPIDTDVETIGSLVRHHLSLTKIGLSIPKDYKQHYSDYLNKVGFKNGREHHRDALLLNISLRNNEIKISPTKNGGFTGKERGFLGIKNLDITVNANIENSELGDKIKYGWTQCECNCI